jgi:hypothetical protein
MSSLNEMYVDSTKSGVLQIENLPDVGSDLEESRGEDSKIDKKLEICKLEKRDFNNEKGME